MKTLRRDPDKGYLDSLLWVPKSQIACEGTKSALTFSFQNDRGITTVQLWKETEHHLLLPREFWNVEDLTFPVVDARPQTYQEVELGSRIVLDFVTPEDTVQREAMEALLASRGGVLQLSCGMGKTVVALDLASRLRVPTLIVVDTDQLLQQWKEAILGSSSRPGLLGVSPDAVGLIRGDMFDWQKPIVLATYHTLAARAAVIPEEVRRWFGLVIWDEAHHIAAPTFAKSADLFYGYRLGLTATPTRTDGLHVIYDLHIGRIIYKNLKQKLRPTIDFLWTGVSLDLSNPVTKLAVCDKNGELHIGKVASYFGQLDERLQIIIGEVKKAREAGRRVLVLSNSIDELINLLSLWSNYPTKYTDIPKPIESDIGETVPAFALDSRARNSLHRQMGKINTLLTDPSINPVKRSQLQQNKTDIYKAFKADDVATRLEAEYRKRQRQYLRGLMNNLTDAGLMIHDVDTETRMELLRTKSVTFAVSKYGREGLDEAALDTVVICEPMSNKNGLQQTMGRALRPKDGKQPPMIVFLEDDVGPMTHMCKKLRQHLREWPIDEGGPYDYQLVGHPYANKAKVRQWMLPRR